MPIEEQFIQGIAGNQEDIANLKWSNVDHDDRIQRNSTGVDHLRHSNVDHDDRITKNAEDISFYTKHKGKIITGLVAGLVLGAGSWIYSVFCNAPVTVIKDLDDKIDQKDYDNAIDGLNAALTNATGNLTNATDKLNETLYDELNNTSNELNETIKTAVNDTMNYTNFVQFVDDAEDLYGALNDTCLLLDAVRIKTDDFGDLLTQYGNLVDDISNFTKANGDLETDINDTLKIIREYTDQDASSLSESNITQLEAAVETLVNLQFKINPDADTDYTNLVQNAENVKQNLHVAAEDVAELQESIPTLPNNYTSYDVYINNTIETLENCFVALSTRNNGTITGPALALMAKLNPCLANYENLQTNLRAKAKENGHGSIDTYIDAIENQANAPNANFDNIESYNASGVKDLTSYNQDISKTLNDAENTVDAWRNIESTFSMNNSAFKDLYQNHSGLLPELDNGTVDRWTDSNLSNREISNVYFTQNNAGTVYKILIRFENDKRVTEIIYEGEEDLKRARELFAIIEPTTRGTSVADVLNDASFSDINLFNPKQSALYAKITKAAV